ncbi:uncharacterized protein LOC119069240 [Bradysia coprophila]|uniref:uncharacterized protein LOC119069240 n=1 Tax=Bradysia coprophila TaxID=38358 RepID=UPI00187DB391|nr:uncharacterized protein LOC119069240 [Bradysia coprophila]
MKWKNSDISVLYRNTKVTMIRLIIAVLIFTTQCSYSSTTTLNCDFEMYPFDTIGSIYTCTGRITINEGAKVTQMYSVAGHMSGKNNGNVLALRMNSKSMTTFPVNVENFFPNIKALHFGENMISHINNSHLNPFPDLRFLSMWNNHLTSLDSNLFAGLTSMSYINFEFNRIMYVGHDFVLPYSAEIRFYSNPCISDMASTPDRISLLKFLLAVKCPPTILHIENSLESRPNLLTNVKDQVQSLQQKNQQFEDKMYYLELRMTSLEAIIEGLEMQIEQRDQM